MAITQVTVNHEERNYFNDYDEIRVDRMSNINNENVAKAVRKLVNRYKSHGAKDTMFVSYDDGTAYRLLFQIVGMEQYEHPVFGTMYRGGRDALTIRHYTNITTDSWDSEQEVSPAKARRMILEGEQQRAREAQPSSGRRPTGEKRQRQRS